MTILSGEQLAAPCGYCRQYIKEFSHNDVVVYRFRNNSKCIWGVFRRATRLLITLPFFFLSLLDPQVWESLCLDSIYRQSPSVTYSNKSFIIKLPEIISIFSRF